MKTIQRYLFIVLLFSLNACAQQVKEENNRTQIFKTDSDWKKQLTPEQYYVLRKEGTEKPFTGKFLLHKEEGVYSCAGCGNPLFTDEMKFDSHCGWPSFDKEISGGKIITKDDYSLGVKRTEIECAKCGGHLGHLFDDGPTETGLRYCVNSLSLDFIKEEDVNKVDTITLGGGCFWCLEGVYELIDGVVEVKSGYSGGKTKNPTYKEVCTGTTGHAEVVQVIYQPSIISLEEILQVFFTAHDPTTLNRQGADIGTQYRSVIFFHNEKQKKTINKMVKILKEKEVFDLPIVTQVNPIADFYTAEGYHQDYYELNKTEPYCKMVILPKIEKVKKVFKEQLK
jgi:peptide methionine sulfoxide reductase msrA/msrB